MKKSLKNIKIKKYPDGGKLFELHQSPLNEKNKLYPQKKWLENWINNPEFEKRLSSNLEEINNNKPFINRVIPYSFPLTTGKDYWNNEAKNIKSNAIKRLTTVKDFYNSDYSKNKELITKYYSSIYPNDKRKAIENVDETLYLEKGSYMPSTHSLLINSNNSDLSTPVHEYTHSTNLDNVLQPLVPQAKSVINEYSRLEKNHPGFKVSYDIFGQPIMSNYETKGFFDKTKYISNDSLSKEMNIDSDIINYINKSDEVYPRIMQLRFENNIKPGEIIDKKRFNSIKKTSGVNTIFDLYGDDEIIMLLNKLANNNKVEQSNMAKNGGVINSYGDGGKVEAKMNSALVNSIQNWQKKGFPKPNYTTTDKPGEVLVQTGQTTLGKPITKQVQKPLATGETESVPVELALMPAARGFGKIGNFLIDELTGSAGFSKKPSFKSEINWSNWNKEIPDNIQLMNEYHTIEQTSKANGNWMKNSDGTPFNGSAEQFVQMKHPNTQKFAGGIKEAEQMYKAPLYRGAHRHVVDFKNRDRNDYATFLTSNEKNAETYATSDGKIKKYFHPDIDKEIESYGKFYPLEKDGKYQLSFPQNLPIIKAQGNGNGWRFLDYDKKIDADGIRAEFNRNNFEYNLNMEKQYQFDYPKDFDLNKNYLSTDDYAAYIKNNPIGIAKIENVKDQMGFSKNISANDVYAIDANKVPLKSLRYNNGMFDMTNPNIYKSIVGGVGLGIAAGQDKEHRNGGVINSFGDGGTVNNNKMKSLKDIKIASRSLKKYEYGGVTKPNYLLSGLSGAASGASMGATIAPPWGAIGGAVIGAGMSLYGSNKGYKQALDAKKIGDANNILQDYEDNKYGKIAKDMAGLSFRKGGKVKSRRIAHACKNKK